LNGVQGAGYGQKIWQHTCMHEPKARGKLGIEKTKNWQSYRDARLAGPAVAVFGFRV